MTDYIAELGRREARAVIAGCTEFSALLTGANSPIPVIDPMVLLAKRAIAIAMEDDSQP